MYSYNDENRLSSYTYAGQTTNYSYNALGQRVKKSNSSGTTHYLYNEQGQLIAEHSSNGAVQKEYIYLHGQVIGMIKDNQLYNVHKDHLGRAERITSQNQTTVWRANNYAFDRSVTTNSIGDYNIGFPGQYWDEKKQSYYNYFRDYDPSTGRYLQSDPIGLLGGINTYGYVGGNPINRFDAFGLATNCEINIALNLIFSSAPDIYTKRPNSIISIQNLTDWRGRTIQGVTSIFDNVEISANRYGDANTAVDPTQYEAFLQTISHESYHVQQGLFERALTRGILHKTIDNNSAKLAKILLQRFKNSLKVENSCECKK